jgi:hypothetical protein
MALLLNSSMKTHTLFADFIDGVPLANKTRISKV